LELVKMQMKAKEELKSTGEEKINSGVSNTIHGFR
jgi:hypothetical protein